MMIMENKEVWKDIKGFEGRFQVSDQGRLRRLGYYTTTNVYIKEKILTPFVWQSRYLRVDIQYKENGVVHRRATYVHTLVAETFIGERPKGYTIDHINRDYLDNRTINLRYVTLKENNNNVDRSYITDDWRDKHSISTKKQWDDNKYKDYMRSCISKRLKGQIQVVNIDNVIKFISPNDLDKYIALGYQRGRRYKAA